MDESLRRAIRTGPPPEDRPAGFSASDLRSLVDLLGRLLDAGGAIVPFTVISTASPSTVRWDDDLYQYLETEIPRALRREADLSVHEGRLFIRIEK